MVLQQKSLEKSRFHCQNNWSGWPVLTNRKPQNPQLPESALQSGNFWVSYESGILCTLSFNELKPENSFRYFTAIVLFITALTTQSCSKESGSHNRQGSLITMAVNFVRATSPWRQNKTIIKGNNDTLYLLLLIFFKTFPFTDKVWVLQYSSCEEGPFDKQL